MTAGKRVAKWLAELPPERLDELRDCAVERKPRALVFDADSECYRAAFPARAPRLRGLGDVVAKLTSAVGIQPCGGCKKRQELLNKLVPFK